MLDMVPELPVVPAFPVLHWSYSNGLYSIEEDDVDRLLDYGENRIPRFRWELEQYQKKLETVLQYLGPRYTN